MESRREEEMKDSIHRNTKTHVDKHPCEVSVIICTYNRSKLLRDALATFAEQKALDNIAYELIVVDNASTDDTGQITHSFLDKLPIRHIVEPELGLSNARNRAIKESNGELVAFVDDDVLFSKHWLIQLVEGAHRWPRAAVFGGKAVAKWEVPKPRWFLETGRFGMRGMISHFEPAQDEGPLKSSPYGCNMAIRSKIFAKYGNFDTDLGRKGADLLSGEEWDFFWRLLAGGEIVVYLPLALVYHRVAADRAEKVYYMRRMKAAGKTWAILHDKNTHRASQSMILRCPPNMWKRLILAVTGWVSALISFRWNTLFGCRLQIVKFWTYFSSRWNVS